MALIRNWLMGPMLVDGDDGFSVLQFTMLNIRNLLNVVPIFVSEYPKFYSFMNGHGHGYGHRDGHMVEHTHNVLLPLMLLTCVRHYIYNGVCSVLLKNQIEIGFHTT